MEGYLIKYVTWAKLKVRLHLKPERQLVYFDEREIWWTSLGANIGYEEDGKNDYFERPVLVLKKFNRHILWILPMTTKIKQGLYYYHLEYKGEKFSIILSQLRLISSKRLQRKIRMLSKVQFQEIRNKVKAII